MGLDSEFFATPPGERERSLLYCRKDWELHNTLMDELGVDHTEALVDVRITRNQLKNVLIRLLYEALDDDIPAEASKVDYIVRIAKALALPTGTVYRYFASW